MIKNFEAVYYDKAYERVADRDFKAQSMFEAMMFAASEIASIQGNAHITEVNVEEISEAELEEDEEDEEV